METLHYTGKVKELGTGKPIAGATVIVRRSILKRNNENTILQETRHTTDANGDYSFTIPPEQVAERYLYIELDVEHPDYATQAGFGYALSMIRKNEKLGGRPFFENVELRPGKPIAGHVERPDGSPAKGVSILAYSRSGKLKAGEGFEYGSFSKAKTDDAGNFKVNVTTPGLAVFWILPDDLAGELHGVPEGKRGDLGKFTLKPGVALKGRVLDVQGKPIAGIFVNAERERDKEAGEILGGLAVADAINRSAVTEADGSFTLEPLPSGEYRVLPGDRARDGSERRKVRPLPAVFTPRKVTLKEGETPEPLEIRASPHVVIEAQWVDGQGKPTTGFANHIFGQIDGGYWFGEAKVGPDGKSVALVPHGLENVQINTMTNEHHAIRWRKAKGEPLSRSRTIMLGTLDHDVKGIEIVHYNAPDRDRERRGQGRQAGTGPQGVCALHPGRKANDAREAHPRRRRAVGRQLREAGGRPLPLRAAPARPRVHRDRRGRRLQARQPQAEDRRRQDRGDHPGAGAEMRLRRTHAPVWRAVLALLGVIAVRPSPAAEPQPLRLPDGAVLERRRFRPPRRQSVRPARLQRRLVSRVVSGAGGPEPEPLRSRPGA